MVSKRDPRSPSADSEYYYRRELTARELVPAIGIGIGVGLAAFYIASLFSQRTPLRPEFRRSSGRFSSEPSVENGG